MKTKVNKVPLVGPRGRRELLDKIEELEKKVSELENGSDQNEDAKTLVIPNFDGTPISEDTDEEFCAKVGITTQQINDLRSRKYMFVTIPGYSTINFYVCVTYSNGVLLCTITGDEDIDYPKMVTCIKIISNDNGVEMFEY